MQFFIINFALEDIISNERSQPIKNVDIRKFACHQTLVKYVMIVWIKLQYLSFMFQVYFIRRKNKNL